MLQPQLHAVFAQLAVTFRGGLLTESEGYLALQTGKLAEQPQPNCRGLRKSAAPLLLVFTVHSQKRCHICGEAQYCGEA